MRTTLLSVALAISSMGTQAQSAPGQSLDLTGEQVGRMAESFDRAVTEGQAWARIKPPLEALYIELRGKGESRQQAIHNLRRIALPGADITEFGNRGQQLRADLEQLAQYVRKKDGLGEPA